MSSYKLYYFDFMGRAEIIRLIFAQAEIPYEDIRIQREEWDSYKQNLVGENEWEFAQVIELLGVGEDLITHSVPWFKCEDAAKKKEILAEFEAKHLVPTFRLLEDILAKNGTGYFVGKKLTAADLDMLCMVGLFSSLCPNSIAQLTNLNDFKDRIMKLPKIKKWIETRPKTDF
ncbi:hypothetical protein X798_03816 [Onchocerca flexuosa]|uniref:Glutathione S-transferase protein n=1 Tax=Onchocerca flexuosa TaxID=387005 RepID=A0A238BUP7_9BILA|nr:hypothetical protein X798_03816 [Onchocerca flexuosa]